MTTTTTGSAGVRYHYVVRGARRKAHRTWPLERARARAH
eukprot:COSAG02_NODE_54718_length_294_cov_1.251282_1_plen_38_part_10